MNDSNDISIAILSREYLQNYDHCLSQIFLDAFTAGEYSHNFGQLTSDYALDVMNSILDGESGFGYAAFDHNALVNPDYPVGFVFGVSASFDPLIEQTALA